MSKDTMRFKKSNLSFTLPSGWHDVPFNKAFEIITQDLTDLQIISILTGHSVKLLKQSTDLETIHYLKQSLLFLNEDPIKKNPEFPVKCMGKPLPYVNYADKFDLGKVTVGQVEDMQAEIAKVDQEDEQGILQVFPVIIAIYMQPIYNNKPYDYDEAIGMVKDVEEQVDYKTMINMGSFFLRKLAGWSTGQKNSLQKVLSPLLKLKQVFSNYLQLLVSMLP